jgi:hypothetical protein
MKYLFLILSLIILTGCSNNVYVTGTVKFADDNTPLEIGTIFFTDGKMQAHSPLGKGGSFSIYTLKKGDGLAPGNYKVFISGAVKEEGGIVQYLTALKYTNEMQTPLTAKIEKKTKLEFKVERATPTNKVSVKK